MTTLNEFQQELQRVEKAINDFAPRPPTPVDSNDNPPKKIIPEQEIERIKREKADHTAAQLSPVLYQLITDRAREVALELVQREIAPLRERLDQLRREFDNLVGLVGG